VHGLVEALQAVDLHLSWQLAGWGVEGQEALGREACLGKVRCFYDLCGRSMHLLF